MILFISIISYVIGFALLFNTIYMLYCIIGLKKLSIQTKINPNHALEHAMKYNIFIFFIKNSRFVRSTKTDILKAVRILRKTTISMILAICIFFVSIFGSFICLLAGLSTSVLNTQLNTVSSVVETLFGHDDDCVCYAKCTGNPEDDKYTAYELLFGQTEYEKLVDDMKDSLTAQEKEQFDDINGTYEAKSEKTKKDVDDDDLINVDTPGKLKSQFILKHITAKMVKDYKEIVGENKNFRSEDGLDRTQMSDEDLEADLKKLFQDYKVNGYNPRCKCRNCSKKQLKYKCLGEEHYKEGMSWSNMWGQDNKTTTTTTTTTSGGGASSGNALGSATGKTAIRLADGSWYWYDQAIELCDYNVKNPENNSVRYGNFWLVSDRASMRGCSTYSHAMAISNVLGREVNPYEFVKKVLKSPIRNNSIDNTKARANGIDFANGMVRVSKETLAPAIEDAFKDEGLHAKKIGDTQSEYDKWLFSDKYDALIVKSFSGRKAPGFNIYRGGGHYMVVRAGSNKGKYRLMTSAGTAYGHSHSAKVKAMNEEYNWSLMSRAFNAAGSIVIYREKGAATASGGNGQQIGYNKEVYNILKNSGKYKGKARIMSIIYSLLEPILGKKIAVGVMACAYHEGKPGLIEKNNGYGYWNRPEVWPAMDKYDGTIVTKKSAEFMLRQLILKSNFYYGDTLYKKGGAIPGVGVGTIQWSGGRRVSLLNIYLKHCINWTQSEFEYCDALMFLKETDKGGGYHDTVKRHCGENLSYYQNGHNICYYYLGNASFAASRGATAADLGNKLSSVHTHGVTGYFTATVNEGQGNTEDTTVTTETTYKEFNTYEMPDKQLTRIARFCSYENGINEKSVRMQATQIVNMYERLKSQASISDWLRTCKWYSSKSRATMDDTAYNVKARKYFDAVEDVIENGNRAFANYITEYDTIEDIKGIKINGEEASVDRATIYSAWKKGKKVIVKNKFGVSYRIASAVKGDTDAFGYVESYFSELNDDNSIVVPNNSKRNKSNVVYDDNWNDSLTSSAESEETSQVEPKKNDTGSATQTKLDTSLNSKGLSKTITDSAEWKNASEKQRQVIEYAVKFVGNPYVWGGNSLTKGTDCSGFVMLIYKHFGKELPHSSASDRSVGSAVRGSSRSDLRPGDIVCYSGHVALYCGGGAIVHASNARDGIKFTANYTYRSPVAIRRIFN